MSEPDSRKRIILEQASPSDEDVVLVLECPPPILRGHTEKGLDHICGVCREVVLLENMTENEVYDVLLQCTCGGVCTSPRLLAGTPLPGHGKLAILLPGRSSIERTIENWHGAVSVSKKAYDRYIKEIGSQHELGREFSITPESLDDMVARMRHLLGKTLEKLEDRHRRGQRSTTPPKDIHPLMALIDDVQRTAELLRKPGVAAINEHWAIAIGELKMALDLYERWQTDPVWPSILSALNNPFNYVHDVAALATATFLAVGHGIGHVPVMGKRTADLQIPASASKWMVLEVKAPKALQRFRPSELTEAEAVQLVRRSIKSANTSSGGQLSPRCPGILVVAGMHLSLAEVQRLIKVTNELLNANGNTMIHIAGIILLVIGVRLVDRLTSPTQPMRLDELIIEPGVMAEFLANPNYAASIVVHKRPFRIGRIEGGSTGKAC
jgi:hypothetical protein